jgi:siroheme synthase
LPELAARLIECGRAPSTPVAVIERATLPEERVVFGTLADIADRARGVESPATIVVGETVGVAASLGVRGRRFRVERETLSPTLIEAR